MSLVLTSSEVKKHNTKKSLWIVIKNDVYDVTSYLNEHPGGEDPLLDAAGQDATVAFEDVGHSEDARTLMRKYKIGTLTKGESCVRLRPKKWMSSPCTTVFTCNDDKKPWRTFDCPKKSKLTPRPSKRSLSPKRSQGTSPCMASGPSKSSTSIAKTPIPRVPSIIVPRERRGSICRKEPPPRGQSGSNLKWALLALALAVIAGVAYKKYAN